MAIKNFGMKTVHSYLQENVYCIPDYQREYSWDEDQLADFWQDLESTIQGDRHHFFGQIVIHEENGQHFIIDGQQRTITAVIFLAVLRDYFVKYENENEEAENAKEDIRIKYIGRWTSKKDELRLRLSISDRDYFKEQIQKAHPTNEGKTPSQKRIFFAYNFFEKIIDDQLSSLSDDTDSCVDKLLQYYDTLLNKFELMAVTTDDINEAFIIFETLNARGKELETADLLKNYVFMQSGSNIESVKNKWLSMLDSLDKKDDATKFIRYYWNSSHSFTRERSLYKEISRGIKPSKCEEFVSTLNDLVELYNALSNPENSYFSDVEIADLLNNLSIMKTTTFYPIIMAMQLKGYNEVDIKRVIKALEVLAFRNFVVAGQTANKYEIIFSKIALGITNGEIDVDKAISDIVKETNDDETFKRNLIGLEVKTVNIAKYILREIEDFEAEEKKVNKDNKTINLEHIMPKNNSQWQVDPEVHSKYLYRLSNQTLLLEEYNKSISNKPFSVKKQMYQNSKIEMTKKLCSYDVWNAASMDAREQELSAVIIKRWALPIQN